MPSYERMLQSASGWLRRVQYEIDMVYLFKAQCDEAALLFANQQELEQFVDWCVQGPHSPSRYKPGLDHFGSVDRDTVIRIGQGEDDNKSGQRFDVRFEFLRFPEDQTWRIEAMCVLDGKAPLHEQALEQYGNGCVIHVSWRAAPNGDGDGYMRHRKVLEAPGHDLHPLAEYGNSYGRFCYYGVGGRPPYLKPRVNLRDH